MASTTSEEVESHEEIEPDEEVGSDEEVGLGEIIHPKLLELFKDRRFWTDFWFTTESELDDPRYAFIDDEDIDHVSFPLTEDGDRLQLSLDSSMCYFELDIVDSDGERWTIGHDDQAHWHPHVLRWEEVELVCRAAAHFNPEGLPHPGLALLLLARWAPICRGDDVAHIAEMLEAAFASTGLFSLKEVHGYIQRWDFQSGGFRWHYNEEKEEWYLQQDKDFTRDCDVYTYRHGEEGEKFPHKQFKDMLARAAQTIANDPPIQLPPRAPSSRRYVSKQTTSLTLKLQVSGPDHSIRCSNGPMITDTIDLTLQTLGLGSCDNTGAMSCGGTRTADLASLKINTDDLELGIDVVRDALRWGRAPEACEMWTARHHTTGESMDMDNNKIALRLEDPQLRYRHCEDEQPELFFLLVDSNCKETGWMWKPWQSRLPLSFMDEVKRLSGVAADSLDRDDDDDSSSSDDSIGPKTADGELMRVYFTKVAGDDDDDDSIGIKTADGGLMRVYFTKVAGDDETKSLKCILAVNKVTREAAAWIHNLLETGLEGAGLALMPPAIVTKELPQGEQPRTYKKLDAEELLEVLEAGPLAWWQADGNRRPYRGTWDQARYEELRRRKRKRRIPERPSS